MTACVLAVILLAVVGFVMFRSESFADIGLQFKAMFAPWTVPVSDPYAVYAVKNDPLLLIACVLCSLPLRKSVVSWFNRRKAAGKKNAFRPWLKALLAVIIFGLSLCFLVAQSFNPFLYFRF